MQEQGLGLAHFWAQSDGVIHTVAVLLLLMSIASWYFILAKAYAAWQMRRVRRDALERFWHAPTLEAATLALKGQDPSGLFTALAQAAQQAGQGGRPGTPPKGPVLAGAKSTPVPQRK